MSGAVAGIIGTSCIFPIDLVKTRLQNQSATHRQYNGFVDCFRKCLKADGLRGMYRGLGPNLIGVTPEKAIKLSVNDAMREWSAGQVGNGATPNKLPLQYEILSGAMAGFCQVIATNPMEMIKIQMQMDSLNRQPGEKAIGLGELVRKLGLKGVYRGTAATLCRDVPFSFMFFPMSSHVKELFRDKDSGEMPFYGAMAGGMLAGGITAVLSTPMDVVKTKLQVVQKDPDAPRYNGIADCYRKVHAQDGMAGFFKGSVPRFCIVGSLFGVTLAVYEVQQRYFAK